MTDRAVWFAGSSWEQLEELPQDRRAAARRAVVHLLEDPVPSLADPFPDEDPIPGAYVLTLPSDGVSIWYVVGSTTDGREIISIQRVAVSD